MFSVKNSTTTIIIIIIIIIIKYEGIFFNFFLIYFIIQLNFSKRENPSMSIVNLNLFLNL